MQLKVLDNIQANVLAVLNNDLPNALHYRDDKWHSYAAEGSSSYEFTIDKYKDGKLIEGLDIFSFGNHISFKYIDIKKMMKMVSIKENRLTKIITCVDVSLELISEDVEAYVANEPHTIEWYFSTFGLQIGNIIIGLNELSTLKKTLSWDGKQTKYSRLLSIVNKFDGECEFVHELNQNGSLKNIIVNIYKKNDGGMSHGIGKDRSDVLLTIGKDIEDINRDIDGRNIFTAVRATGKDGLRTTSVSLSERNSSGQEEYYLRRGSDTAYAPLAADLYPANTKNAGSMDDKWVLRILESEYTTEADLGAYMISVLKKNAYPIISYNLNMATSIEWLKYGLNLGDTIKITDMSFNNTGLILKARVAELIISFSNPSQNSIVLSNFIELKSKLSSDILSIMDKLINDKTPYISTLSSTGSIIFKKLTDTTTLTPIVNKGEKEVSLTSDFSFSWLVNDTEKSTNKSFTVKYSDLTEETNLVTLNIYKNSEKISSAQISLSKIADGISPINLFIKSSNGYQFKNNVINTTFTAILYQNNKEIDSDSTKFSYVWTKTNADGTADIAWNLAHQSSQKSITISNSDVSQRATFNCTAEPLN